MSLNPTAEIRQRWDRSMSCPLDAPDSERPGQQLNFADLRAAKLQDEELYSAIATHMGIKEDLELAWGEGGWVQKTQDVADSVLAQVSLGELHGVVLATPRWESGRVAVGERLAAGDPKGKPSVSSSGDVAGPKLAGL